MVYFVWKNGWTDLYIMGIDFDGKRTILMISGQSNNYGFKAVLHLVLIMYGVTYFGVTLRTLYAGICLLNY